MEQKPKCKPQYKSYFSFQLGIFLGLLSIFLCAIGLLLASAFVRQDFIDSNALMSIVETDGEEAYERMSEYKPPNSATDFFWYSYRGFTSDYERKIRFSLPAIDVEQWLSDSGLCFQLPLEPNTRTVSPTDTLTWWQHDNAETFMGGSCGDDPYYRLLIDQTDTTTWVIYLEVFKT